LHIFDGYHILAARFLQPREKSHAAAATAIRSPGPYHATDFSRVARIRCRDEFPKVLDSSARHPQLRDWRGDMVARGIGTGALGLRRPDPPEERTLEIVLPKSVWQQVDDAAREVGITDADAIAQIIGDACWQASAPAPRPQPRQRKPRQTAL
jgi:hypothetical protein